MKEKLIELIAQKVCGAYSPTCDEWQPHDCGKCYANDCRIADLADHLIDNVVTLDEDNNVPSKWISVNDRLPDLELAEIRSNDYSALYPCLVAGKHITDSNRRYIVKAWYDEDSFVSGDGLGLRNSVTHWMPLPQPPKGE